MRGNVYPNEVKAMGWYALRWMQITDWYRKTSKGRKPQDKQVGKEHTASQNGAEETKEKESGDEKKLDQVIKESSNALVKADTVFPFTLFPTTIVVDRHKLSLIYRTFFKVEQTVSVPLDDIKNIHANLGPFFGSVTITSDNFVNNTQQVHFLTRGDAVKIQKMVQGAMVALNEQIDVSKVKVGKLKKQLEQLGGAHAIK